MKDFAGKIAVITGGGTGMGRELARQLVAEGCNVAMCDVSAEAMAETKRLCEVERLPQGLRITTHLADVSIEDQFLRFRDELMEQQATDKIHLLFNNAGIGGGGSLFTSTREQWERTFNICWGGVYLGVRTFLPLLVKADEGHIVNTSSVNGFWASVGLGVSHTAYCSAKFAVKGFTEALMNDLRLNAPHIKCSVVMPGHIGTSIVSNSRKVQNGSDQLTPNEIVQSRQRLKGMGIDVAGLSDDQIQQIALDRAQKFHDEAPTTAAAPQRSSSKASRPSAGASWSATTPTGSMSVYGKLRKKPTRRSFIRASPRRSAGGWGEGPCRSGAGAKRANSDVQLHIEEPRDSPTCNCTSEFDAVHRPGMTFGRYPCTTVFAIMQ